MGIEYNPTIYCGATWVRTLYLKQPNRSAVDITGCTARMQIRTSADATSATLDLTSSPAAGIVVTGSDGKIEITISKTQTATLTASTYVYAIELTWPDTTVDRITEGTITASQEVVR